VNNGAFSAVFLVLAILCAAVGVALMMAMTGVVQAHGQKISWVFLRLYVLKYINDYRNLTTKRLGRPGPLFYPFIVFMNLALLFALLGLVLQ
jgi:hypothetical protein